VYEKGVEDFLKFTKQNRGGINERYYYPVNCLNGKRLDIELIREHVLCDDFLKSYTTWTWHGEVLDLPYVFETECQHSNIYFEDCMEDMIRDIGEDSFHQAHVYDSLKDDSVTKLYPDCSSFLRLSKVLQLFNIKARMSGLIKVSLNCLNCRMKYFHKVIYYRAIIMRPR